MRLRRQRNYPYIQTFEDLKQYGVTQLKKHKNGELLLRDNITGIETQLEGEYLDQMIELNKYIYTTASTNFYHNCLWFVGVCPLSTAKFLAQKLKDLQLWYIISDNNNKLLDMFIDESKRLPFFMRRGYSSNYTPILNSIGWVSENDKQYLINTPHYFYHTDKIRALPLKPNSIETYRYTNPSLYVGDDPLVSITIEDPNQNDILYQVVIDILQENNDSIVIKFLQGLV